MRQLSSKAVALVTRRKRIPTALGLALSWLRSKAGWSKAELAQDRGIKDDSAINRYETGEKPLSREYLDWLLTPLPYPPEAVDVLVFAHDLIVPDPREEPASPVALTSEERRTIDRAVMGGALLAAEELRAELIRSKKAEKVAAACQEAEEAWLRLKEAATLKERHELVTTLPEYGTWAVAKRVCEASVRAAARDAQKALELAELALFIAERVPGEESWRRRVEGYCWAHIGNARRVAEDYDGADESFARSWNLWRAGADSDPELLPEWLLLALEASLRREQHQFPQALKLLDRALVSCGGTATGVCPILLEKEHVLSQMGDVHGALTVLFEAAPFVEAMGDPRQLFAFRFNMADDLCGLERYDEAADLLPQLRELAAQQASELDLIRGVWLQAKVDAGQGREEEAVAGLEQVRGEFTARGLPYDAALSSLYLAVLWLKGGRTTKVRNLALAMGWIFKDKGIAREALAALTLFCEAAKRERATMDLARRVIADVEKARRSASPTE